MFSRHHLRSRPAAAALILLAVLATKSAGQTGPSPTGDRATRGDALVLDQEQLAEKYRRFEDVLLRMAEVKAAEDPQRAALLRKVVTESKDQLVTMQFERLVGLLSQGRLALATENQQEVIADLKKLLDLLLSEDRAKRLENKKARLRDMIKQVNKIIRRQRSLRAQTERRGDPKRLAGQQGDLSERTGRLAEQMKAAGGQNQGSGKSESDKSGEPREGETPEGKGPGQSPGKGQGKGQPEGKGQEQPPGQPGESPPSGESSAEQRLEAARQRMREAQKKLEEARREQAAEKQEAALQELEQAKADLEEVLRQLREEELKRMLAVLEARFRKMLKMQMDVLEGTRRLAVIPPPRRDRSTEIQSGRLSRSESLIDVEADKALVLLHEEGTAVALPEAVEQMREDIQQTVLRLAQVKTDEITLALEQDIVAALEEMIAALKKAQQELEQKQQPSNPPPSGQQKEPSLIDRLAELKMIRSLQMRVNRRTERYAKLVEGERTDSDNLLEALDRLAEREERIFRATRDIVTGRNR